MDIRGQGRKEDEKKEKRERKREMEGHGIPPKAGFIAKEKRLPKSSYHCRGPSVSKMWFSSAFRVCPLSLDNQQGGWGSF